MREARQRVNEAGDLKFLLMDLTHLKAQRPRALQEPRVELFRGPMTWNRRYQITSYLRSSLWIIPLVALPLQWAAWELVQVLDHRFAWKGLALGVTGAQAMFNAVITLTLS
jgi:hypothetical protein